MDGVENIEQQLFVLCVLWLVFPLDIPSKPHSPSSLFQLHEVLFGTISLRALPFVQRLDEEVLVYFAFQWLSFLLTKGDFVEFIYFQIHLLVVPNVEFMAYNCTIYQNDVSD